MVFMTIWSVEEYFLCLQGKAAARNMMLPVEARIDSDLLEDEYFNFSVRVHASWPVTEYRLSVCRPFPISGACSFRMGSRRRVGSGKCSPDACCIYLCCCRRWVLYMCSQWSPHYLSECVFLAICHGVPVWSDSVEQYVSGTLYPPLFPNNAVVPAYLYGIIAGIVVLVLVFLAIVGIIGYYYYKRNKVVIMKVSLKGSLQCQQWVLIH